jgi:mannose-1-phosphate guanylyltransferase
MPLRLGETGRMMNMANHPAPNARMPRHCWAVLLAGGDGTRLPDFTVTIGGDQRPKQFCPIVGPRSLLSQTRARLDPLFAGDRQAFVVCSAHERYYSKELADAKDSLVIAQPLNRGTAVGILVALGSGHAS